LPIGEARFWPFALGSFAEPPSPTPMYRFPSGPKAIQPPLWLVKGSAQLIIVTPAVFATSGFAAERV